MNRNVYLTLTLALLIAVSLRAEKTATHAWFRYAPYGHSLLADMHPNFARFDVAAVSNHQEWDWGNTGKKMRVNTFGILGINLPIWNSSFVDNKYGLAVTMPLSFSIFLDLGEHTTAPVVDTDYRISLPQWTFIHRLDKPFLINYSVSLKMFNHESTHLGDEMTIQRTERSLPLKRVNVSYNYSEYIFTLNEAEDFTRQTHTFRAGLMLIYNWKQGWYFIDKTDGDPSLAQPRLSPFEVYVQYQYQTRQSKHGFQFVGSAEIRNRALYGYPMMEYDEATGVTYQLQKEKRVFTYNIFVGARFCNPLYDGYFSRVALGIRAYHGNNPYGQFRNHPNYNHVGVSLCIE